MPRDNGELHDDYWVRCPVCGEKEEAHDQGQKALFNDQAITEIWCGWCDHKYKVTTSVTWTFTSPKMIPTESLSEEQSIDLP